MALPNAVLYVQHIPLSEFFDLILADADLRIFNADELEGEIEDGREWKTIAQCVVFGEALFLSQPIRVEAARGRVG